MYHTHHPPRNFTLQGPKKETHTHTHTHKHKVSRRKEIIKIRPTAEKISKTKTQFFEEVKQDWQSLSRTNQGEKKDPRINKITNERGDITTDTTGIQKITRLV